jgi:hypothetical protein
VRIQIEGSDLPGRDCPGSGNFPGYRNVHVGVQRRNRPTELLELKAADAPSVSWSFEVTVLSTAAGTDLRGPYLQAGPHRRFIYLSWGRVDHESNFLMFRRAKLLLADVEPTVLAAALRSGILIARLGLTDPKGQPVCAWIKPPAVRWSAGRTPASTKLGSAHDR